MSSKEEWARYQDALRSGDRAAAADAFRRYLAAKKAEGRGGSRPTIVRLKTGPGWHSVPVEEIPERIIEDPEFFESMTEIAGREKR